MFSLSFLYIIVVLISHNELLHRFDHRLDEGDFGFIETLSSDTDTPMEVFRSDKKGNVDAIAVCADIINKRFEVKALVGLNEDECQEVLHFLNCTDYQKSVLLRRGRQIPSWSETE